MKEKILRDGPAFEPELPISFQNFHQRTRAVFRPSEVPDREPDFVSPGRSVYWDLGHAVIRASDHWSEQNGCREIGGCFWTYEDLCAPGSWEVGICAYASFVRRVRTFPTRPATEADLALASLIFTTGGGIDPQLWAGRPGSPQVPEWARVAPRGTLAAAPARTYLDENPLSTRVLTADRSVLRRILEEMVVQLPAQTF